MLMIYTKTEIHWKPAMAKASYHILGYNKRKIIQDSSWK